MDSFLSTKLLFFLALFSALIAGGIWIILVRPVPEKKGTGTITGRIFVKAETVEKSIPRVGRSLEDQPRDIRYNLPDRYRFSIRLDDSGKEVHFIAPALLPTERIEIGQHVRVVYFERYIPFWGSRIYVKEMTPLS